MTESSPSKKKNDSEQTGEEHDRRRLCPFVENPFSDCYCKDMNSLKITRASFYCLGNYTMCEYYKKDLDTPT